MDGVGIWPPPDMGRERLEKGPVDLFSEQPAAAGGAHEVGGGLRSPQPYRL